ncbi:MAG: methylated-DNA--[protein]-cysteine S-methyltransferase [Planctomycetota bacterium]
MTTTLPPRARMLRAFLDKDPGFEGVFLTAVKTTGIFCRPTCSARKPKPENVAFYATAREALDAGFRPCLRCAPLVPEGETPAWAEALLEALEREPQRRWSDADLEARGLSPRRVRRWFQQQRGNTFHAYARARRLGQALSELNHGAPVSDVAFAHGYDSLSGFGAAFQQFAGAAPSAARARGVVEVARLTSPLGPLVAGAFQDEVVLLEFADRKGLPGQLTTLAKRLRASFAPGRPAVLAALAAELDAYFAGRGAGFQVPLRAPGTPFQQAVWAALGELEPGTTCSYGELARRLGRPSAVRAVARANGHNRLAILIPCHRVVGSDGALTGYGGGLWRKRRLLELEGWRPPAGRG